MEYLVHIAIIISIYAILALSLNLIAGYTGLLSYTHAAFYGIGAYAVAILCTSLHFNFFIAMAIGVITAAAIATILGLVLGKFKGDYYAMTSFGFGIIVYSVFLNLTKLTNGPLGITKIPRPKFLSIILHSNFNFLLLCIAFALLAYLLISHLTKTPFGQALKAIREDEKALSTFGYDTKIFKTISFTIGASLAAIAGSLFASYSTFIDPQTFSASESIFILAIVIIGGLADLRGSILSAIIIIALPEALRFLGLPAGLAANLRQIFYGLALIILMFIRPQGFLGKYKM